MCVRYTLKRTKGTNLVAASNEWRTDEPSPVVVGIHSRAGEGAARRSGSRNSVGENLSGEGSDEEEEDESVPETRETMK